jgi:hypothetical protein
MQVQPVQQQGYPQGQPMMQQPGQPMMQQPGQPMMQQPGQPMMMVPVQVMQGDLLTATLANVRNLHISQSWKIEGCCNIQNVYTVQSGLERGEERIFGELPGQPILFRAEEDSDCCTRLCCKPLHGLKLHLKDFPGAPGVTQYTIERPGCCSKPGLCCCALNDGCTDEMRFHEGNVMGEPGSMPQDRVKFVAKQAPAAESMFEPVINISTPESMGQPLLSIRGPMIFGGWSELCCSSEFPVTGKNADGTLRDAGTVVKLAPTNCCQCCLECATPVDNFAIYFNDAQPQDKPPMMVAAFLADFMLFEQDEGLCHRRSDGTIVCTLFQCYCAGCICPCNIYCKAQGGGG